ncbi:MAG TPA: hypothetical protein DC017_06065 [Candidatus Wallbacteria bacterium]|nr:hypothetical protein [Candidatus Wallbacteria bacterium]
MKGGDAISMQNLKCQKCGSHFKTEHISGVTVQTCPGCKLVFIDGVEVTRLREGFAAATARPDHGYDKTAATHLISEKCPRCEVKLRDEEYIHNSDIHFKLCDKCLSIMFDAGELNKLKHYQISPETRIYDAFEELFPVMKKVMAG